MDSNSDGYRVPGYRRGRTEVLELGEPSQHSLSLPKQQEPHNPNFIDEETGLEGPFPGPSPLPELPRGPALL